MDVWEAVNSIRVVREFSDRALSEAQLTRIVNAGRRAGSSKNLQRWGFIVVTDRDHLQDLVSVGPFAGHVGGAAAAIALVTPDPRGPDLPLSVTFDLGRAAQNMVLVAWELGIGSCPATVYEQELARKLLGYPSDHYCEYILSFGYPADESALSQPKQPGGRLSIGEVFHRETW